MIRWYSLATIEPLIEAAVAVAAGSNYILPADRAGA